MDGQGIASAAFARDAQGVVAAVLMQIADVKCGDFRAAETHLQTHGQYGPVALAPDSIRIWIIEDLAPSSAAIDLLRAGGDQEENRR